MGKVAVIIPAAGKGERFGAEPPKPFANLGGRPIFIRCLEHFINRDDVCQTILAVGPSDMDMVKKRYGPNLGFMGVTLVEGGQKRFETVAKALEKVSEDAELVAIHDGVRPCVTKPMIDAVFAEAAKAGAAMLASPLVGTIKRVNDSKTVEETVSRQGLWEAQTPQVFKRDLILQAYENAKNIEDPITDDAQLVELAGHPVQVVESDPTNLKITAKSDVSLANAILKARPAPKVSGPRGPFEEAQW
jgi:2-C-methyl-D-erythritol 4-phosphate cytidylyltransferase